MHEIDPALSSEIFSILQHTGVGIAIADGDGCLVWGNHRYAEISGLRLEAIMGQNLEQVGRAENIEVAGAESLFSLVSRSRRSITRMVDFNIERDISVTGTPLFGDDGRLRWVIYTLTDWAEVSNLRRKLDEMTEASETSRRQLQEAMLGQFREQGVIARDKGMHDVYAAALRIARVEATLLILGETGTGKDHLANFIHNSSPREKGPFVHVNCSAIPESLFEAELFGYEPGAFTGAGRHGRMGLIEFANQGTLYLDEVAELPLNMQAKLLTVLQTRNLVRVGGNNSRPVNVRVIAATNMDLLGLVRQKKFREDLFYRLNVLEIRMPPLRERRNDISEFINHFTELFNEKYRQHRSFDPRAVSALMRYDWPGNVRELEHLVERLVIMCPEDVISCEHLPPEVLGEAAALPEGGTLKAILERVEARVIREAVESSGSLRQAADRLGIELSTLTKKKQKYDIYKLKRRSSRIEEER